MALFNYATKEITIKIVYYGPGLSGKTTNLQYLHSKLDANSKGRLLSLATEADRTLFFDFLPVELGKLNDFSIRFQLYTVPGQVRYNATRKLVLKGADAVVFVADSQREMREQNIESLKNMKENLIENNINPDDIPIFLQYNKRDLPNILSVEELNQDLNKNGKYEFKESIAIDGIGVEDTFRRITKLVMKDLAKRHKINFKTDKKFADIMEDDYTQPVKVNESEKERIFVPESLTTKRSEVVQAKYDIELDKEYADPGVEEDYQQKDILVKEIKEIREIPIIPLEKIDLMIKGLNDIAQTLREMTELFSEINNEIKESKKEQKEMNIMLREIRNNFQKIKTKRKWFRFI